MSWDALPPEIRDAATHQLTSDELDVLKLASHGYGYRRIATILNISRDTARNRYQRAIAKLRSALDEKGISIEQALR